MDLFRYFVLGDISACRYYLDAMDTAVPPARDRAFNELKQQAECHSWSYEEYAMERQGLEGVYDHIMPEVLCRSLLVYLHSRIEVQLAVVARYLRKHRALDLQLTELSGSPIERVKAYLVKVANVPVAELPQWSTLRDLQKIRDVIVHRGGEIGHDKGEQERLRQLSLRYPDLITVSHSWDRGDSELQFGPDLCRHFITAAEGFFEALLDHFRHDGRQSVVADGDACKRD